MPEYAQLRASTTAGRRRPAEAAASPSKIYANTSVRVSGSAFQIAFEAPALHFFGPPEGMSMEEHLVLFILEYLMTQGAAEPKLQ